MKSLTELMPFRFTSCSKLYQLNDSFLKNKEKKEPKEKREPTQTVIHQQHQLYTSLATINKFQLQHQLNEFRFVSWQTLYNSGLVKDHNFSGNEITTTYFFNIKLSNFSKDLTSRTRAIRTKFNIIGELDRVTKVTATYSIATNLI
ncbi:hypothetical protein ACTFIU_007081 [Dictyostelium citrinum]